MTNVTKLQEAPRLPSAGEAKRDAIAALVDSVTGNVAEATREARKALDHFDETALAHGSRIKMELEVFVESMESIARDAAQMEERVVKIRQEHARLVNQRVQE